MYQVNHQNQHHKNLKKKFQGLNAPLLLQWSKIVAQQQALGKISGYYRGFHYIGKTIDRHYGGITFFSKERFPRLKTLHVSKIYCPYWKWSCPYQRICFSVFRFLLCSKNKLIMCLARCKASWNSLAVCSFFYQLFLYFCLQVHSVLVHQRVYLLSWLKLYIC